MARQDPKKALAAQGLPEYPIGTLDELKDANLPPSMFPSCAEPQADGTVVGCRKWHDCDMSYKGLHSKDGGGPRNHCWERIKSAANGGGVVRNCQPCYFGAGQAQDLARDNGEVLQVIANEGEDYEYLTFVAAPKASDPTYREQQIVKATVPAFKRPRENQKTKAQVLRASITQREQSRVRKEAAAEVLGISGGITPLDKRGTGSRKVSPSKEQSES